MKADKPSRTAEGIAILRALESTKPEDERICYDPFARALVKPTSYFFSKLTVESGLYGLLFRGGLEYVVARDRYIDDYLISALSAAVGQVVILGAGFDTRPYRIAGIERTRVFEVDHPNTQELKLKRLKRAIDPLPGHVTFVPVDFNRQQLGERLHASGYDEREKTVFIWQGVTPYLTPAGVDSTLSFIANYSKPESSVIFDYFYSFVLRISRGPFVVVRTILELLGESLQFGIKQGEVESFLTARGFTNVHNTTTKELKELYFTGSRAELMMPTGIAIASASVADKGSKL